jgi:hypothetical protein
VEDRGTAWKTDGCVSPRRSGSEGYVTPSDTILENNWRNNSTQFSINLKRCLYRNTWGYERIEGI